MIKPQDIDMPDGDNKGGQFLPRTEFAPWARRMEGSVGNLETAVANLPKELRAEMEKSVSSAKLPILPILAIGISVLGTFTGVALALVSSLVIFINLRFTIERQHQTEYNQLQQAAQAQVWRQQNTAAEKTENILQDLLLDGYKRYHDNLERRNDP